MLLQNGLIDTNWIMSQNQLVPIRPCCYSQIFPNTAAMHSAQRNLQNEWPTNILAQNKVDFPNLWCSDLQYITPARACVAWLSCVFLAVRRASPGWLLRGSLGCIQDAFARARTRPKGARDDRVSCIQVIGLAVSHYLMYWISRASLGRLLDCCVRIARLTSYMR